jgi:hypothetical protein
MPYMFYQQYETAVKQAYSGHPDAARHAATATSCRKWLESLEITPQVRDTLVEQMRVLEEAFQDAARTST